ncbi:MAG: hypothetical protein GY697_26485, partial [Desulfobacterales bacterium]|nr:hypothetical protein [Desulfobacterales bacterium]
MLSPRPPPLVHKARALESLAGCEIVDVIRCRKRALEFCVHDLPVFCPLDDIQARTERVLGDVNFVDKKYTSFVRQLGYTGPGWQHRVLTEWLLYAGVITWEDVTHTLTATGRIPANILAEPLRRMEEAWQGDRDRAKFSVNSLIGLWAIDDAFSYRHSSSSHESDAPQGLHHRDTFYFEGGSVCDFVSVTRLTSNTSCRPLSDLCLCTEAVRVGQILLELRRVRATPCECKTDSVLYIPLKRTKPQLASLRFRDLNSLRDAGDNMRPLDQHGMLRPIPSDEPVFRVSQATERDLMRSH